MWSLNHEIMEINLQAQIREAQEKLPADVIAGVVYGPGFTNKNLKFKRLELEKVFAAAGESNLITLNIEGDKPLSVLVKDIQRDNQRGLINHIDLYKVDMSKKIVTNIPLHFSGESKAVKELGGMLDKNMHEIEVECLPKDLIDHIEVDISGLLTFEDVIKVKDLKVPANIQVMAHDSEVVALVLEPRVEVEPTPAPVAAPVATDKKDEKGGDKGDKKDEKKSSDKK